MGEGDSFLKVLGIDPYKIHGCCGCWRGVGEGDGGCNNLLFLIMDVEIVSACFCIVSAMFCIVLSGRSPNPHKSKVFSVLFL